METVIFTGYESIKQLLKKELTQLVFEGKSIPREIISEIEQMAESDSSAAREIRKKLDQCATDSNYQSNHPYLLEEIRKQRPDGPRKFDMGLSDQELLDKFHGAWSGRSVGCALGKPVEELGMNGTDLLTGRSAIRSYLQAQNRWSLSDYFSGNSKLDDITLPESSLSIKENIQFMEPDDDIHYTLIGIKVLEQYGRNFTWFNIADTWNSSLPYNSICTAETQGIINYNLKTPKGYNNGDFTTPEFTSYNNNPYREWIGAQIRADGWAYACAGNPELAAEFAYRDAHWTHRANGIYGEMFMAAVIAASFAVSDPRELVQIGLSEIPQDSKLAWAIKEAIQWVEECRTFEDFMDKLDEKYAGMSPVHSINNALIVIMSLFYGNMEFDKSICTSVMGALDTDCNGATTGSIVGAVNGLNGVKSELIPPLNDTIKPLVFGFQEITMKELAERTLSLWKSIS